MADTIESIVYSRLSNDTNITSRLSQYESKPGVFVPAIFSPIAPQEAIEPYIVYDIQSANTQGHVINNFILDIDLYDKTSSQSTMKEIIKYITDNLDYQDPDGNNEFSTVRFYYESDGYIETNDINILRYNQQFSGRASRKGWIDRTR